MTEIKRKSGSVELEKGDYEKFRIFLKQNKIKYYPSACYNLIHVSVETTTAEREMIEQFLGTL